MIALRIKDIGQRQPACQRECIARPQALLVRCRHQVENHCGLVVCIHGTIEFSKQALNFDRLRMPVSQRLLSEAKRQGVELFCFFSLPQLPVQVAQIPVTRHSYPVFLAKCLVGNHQGVFHRFQCRGPVPGGNSLLCQLCHFLPGLLNYCMGNSC